ASPLVETLVRDARVCQERQGRLLLPKRAEVQHEIRDVRLQRRGEPRRRRHVADRLRSDGVDRRRRGKDRRAREESGELRTGSPGRRGLSGPAWLSRTTRWTSGGRWSGPARRRGRRSRRRARLTYRDTMSIATWTDAQSPAPRVADRHDLIRVHGARVNNLKDVSVELPKRRLTVFTGVSGSGKSSLVFATIAAESQR